MLRPSPNHDGTQRLPNDDDDHKPKLNFGLITAVRLCTGETNLALSCLLQSTDAVNMSCRPSNVDNKSTNLRMREEAYRKDNNNRHCMTLIRTINQVKWMSMTFPKHVRAF